MKAFFKIAIVTCAAALTAVFLWAQSSDDDKAKDKAAKAKRIADIYQNNSRVLTMYDRQGKVAGTIEQRAIYNQPILSPDRTRILTTKTDLDKETNDLWVVDIATGKNTQITNSKAREGARGPAWSPDGKQVAYIAIRNEVEAVYRRASNGEGPEELLYKFPGAGLNLTDWSMDGRYISIFSSNLAGATAYAIPLAGEGERKPIEMFHSTFQILGTRLSPDSRFVSYMSNESGRNEMYVRRFDPTGAATGANAGPWQISDNGGQGMGFWRRDGKEFYYLANDRGIMAVEVSTSPAFEFGKPKLLFRPPEGVAFAPGTSNVSRDGERFLIAVPPSQLRQITVIDRQGKVVSKVGEPGVFNQVALSHDGKKVAVGRVDSKSGNQDIWVYDLATGKGNAVTSDRWPDNSPAWSADDSQVAYVSSHDDGKYWGIYRKAANGTGNDEMLFQYTPGAFVGFSDWSADGKFLTFSTGVLLMVPLDQGGAKGVDRKAIEWLRDEYNEFNGRFSPDSRWVAYGSDELGANQVGLYVRRFDAAKPEAPGPGPAVEVTKGQGIKGMINWRKDGKELYYLDTSDNVTAVEVSTTPVFQASAPKVLFKAPTPPIGITDGERFVFLAPAR